MEEKYEASVAEFEKVALKDPKGKIGLQSLFRAATTQMLYLSQYREALKNFKLFVERSGETPESWVAKKQIGDLLFSKLEQYDQTIDFYRSLMRQNPKSIEAAEFQFRIGRSYFFLWKFEEAIKAYEELIALFPESIWAEVAQFDIAETLFTSAQTNESYRVAMEAYLTFIKKYPRSHRLPQAKFGVAACLEEMDQLDIAYLKYLELLKTYPSPKVVQVKLGRIAERKRQRNH